MEIIPEEAELTPPSEEPRYCPVCGSRVAAMATTCLMCGADLTAPPEQEEPVRREMPVWLRWLIIVALALAILSAGSFGLYKLLSSLPAHEGRIITPTPLPSRTATPTITPTPSATPTPTSTPTPVPPLAHQVQRGETLSGIASTYGLTIDDILALNPDIDPNRLQVGQVILIPAGTPTPGPTNTFDPNVPTPTPANYIIHIVARGETLSDIAEQYNTSVAVIKAANDIPPDDDTIRVNQSLVIPLGTPMPTPTATVNPHATPTPIPPYPAPPLLSPPDGAVLIGDGTPILLQWASVSILRDNEWYELTLRQPGGGVYSATVRTRATAWRVPPELLPPPDAAEHDFYWQVQVVQETTDAEGQVVYHRAGLPSEIRTFTWLPATPTPAPVRPSPTP